MRYEAKHKYFKKIAQILGNFKNIEKTVATRHQRHMCYKMACTMHFLGGENQYGPGSYNNNNYCCTLLIYFPYKARRVQVNELEYATSLPEQSDSTVHR